MLRLPQQTNRKKAYVILGLTLMAGTTLVMGGFVGLTWLGLVGMALLAGHCFCLVFRQRTTRWELALVWIWTLVIWRSLLLGEGVVFRLDNYFAVIGGLIAGAVLLAARRIPDPFLGAHWRVLGMTWAFLAVLIWLLSAYLQDLSLPFHVGLVVSVLLLVACRRLFRLSIFGTQVVNTLILLLVALPVSDAALRPSYRMDERPERGKRYYSYEFARKNPTAFARWWYHFVRVWEVAKSKVFIPDPEGVTPFLLRPGGQVKVFESLIKINHLGFRGPEVEFEKGNAYRIVALGESTTFGHTLRATDVPWPEVLQRLIVERLKPKRPVQVINAGIPSYTILHNLHRLGKDILPLQPDMIISYHGYNGFIMLDPALPRLYGREPPAYENRPLKLLADSEYRIKLMVYKHRRFTAIEDTPKPEQSPMETYYAQAYEQLIHIAHTNRIKLVLANYSMSVNDQSDEDVVAFYRAAFPLVLAQIRANAIHAEIVEELGRLHPEITVVDTHPALDGKFDQFIDLVHFTQEGRELLAETILSTIQPTLETELTDVARDSSEAMADGAATTTADENLHPR